MYACSQENGARDGLGMRLVLTKRSKKEDSKEISHRLHHPFHLDQETNVCLITGDY